MERKVIPLSEAWRIYRQIAAMAPSERLRNGTNLLYSGKKLKTQKRVKAPLLGQVA